MPESRAQQALAQLKASEPALRILCCGLWGYAPQARMDLLPFIRRRIENHRGLSRSEMARQHRDAIRHANLALIVDLFAGNLTRMSAGTGISRSHLSRVVHQHKHLGEQAAARIRQALGLPPRWFEYAHTVADAEVEVMPGIVAREAVRQDERKPPLRRGS